MNSLKKISTFGQAIWLDYIRRDLMSSGKLRRLIEEDNLRGITSNPSIFEKAIAQSNLYDEDIQFMVREGKDAKEIYETIIQRDVRDAADAFRSLYDKMKAKDGYVSLEVNPHLAHDTQGTIIEARRLWKSLNRPNVFIKVPATLEGLPAITQLISEGVNINVTLLFGLPRYQEVAQAYMAGIEKRVDQGQPIEQVASVASFFLSRIDTLIDPILDKIIEQGGEKAVLAKKIHGQVAIASAKVAYQMYHERVDARGQRLLWASTSTKNPAYSDIKYIEALIGPDTINTLPLETLETYRDHGDPKQRLQEKLDEAHWVFKQLRTLDINIDDITQQLEDEGVDKFKKSFDQLIVLLEKKIRMEP